MTSPVKKPVLDLNDFVNTCAPKKQVMVYGLESCGYKAVQKWGEALGEEGQLNAIFSYTLAYRYPGFPDTTFEKRKIAKINYDDSSFTGDCKAALVNMVMENYKRIKVGLEPIPVVFVIGKNETKLDIARIFEKGKKDEKITDAEIKRAYKLCFDSGVEEEIRTAAKDTFMFIELISNESTASALYSFNKVPSPWESPEWKALYGKQAKTVKTDFKPYFWRQEILKLKK